MSKPGLLKKVSQRVPRNALWLIVALNVFWGLNWPMVKLAVNEMPVLSFRAICVYGGAAGLFLVALASRQSLAVPRGAWRVLIFCAVFNITFWHLLGAYGVSLLNWAAPRYSASPCPCGPYCWAPGCWVSASRRAALPA